MIRAYHASRGEATSATRSSPPSSPIPRTPPAAKVAGYKVITLYPDADGYPDLDALKAAVSERTAALLITNPEDTGIFNPRIERVRADRARGRRPVRLRPGQRQRHPRDHPRSRRRLRPVPFQPAQDVLDAARLRRAGRPAPAASPRRWRRSCPAPSRARRRAVRPRLRPAAVHRQGPALARGRAQPGPGVRLDDEPGRGWPARGRRDGRAQQQLPHGPVLAIRGVSAPYAKGRRRIEQVRYSWEELARETGVHSEEIGSRVADYGTHYWTSHHPYVVPEPMTLEPTESYSMADLDEYAAILATSLARRTRTGTRCSRPLTRARSTGSTTPRSTTRRTGR